MRTNGTSLAPPGAEGKQGTGMVRPDPEVLAKPKRRRFSAAYKLRVLAEAEQCSKPGELGRLLRCEGLYSSHLAAWRKAARIVIDVQGKVAGLPGLSLERGKNS